MHDVPHLAAGCTCTAFLQRHGFTVRTGTTTFQEYLVGIDARLAIDQFFYAMSASPKQFCGAHQNFARTLKTGV